MSDRSSGGGQHHHTDDPWCDWCDEEFEEGQTVVALTWEFPSSDITVTFCSTECAVAWDCADSRKESREVTIHV